MNTARFLLGAGILLGSAFRAEGAATLRGRLVLNSERGVPVEGALVSAVGANQTKSAGGGWFTLEFPNKKPGDLVELSVNYGGMVLVNWVQRKVHLPSDPDASILTLILSPESKYEESARDFYKLKSVAEIEATFRKRLAKEGEGERAQLQRERDEAIATAEQAARELARIRPGEASAFYEEAMRHFAERNVDQALRVLDEGKLRAAVLAAKEQRQQAEKRLADAVMGYRLRGRMLSNRFQFAEAENAFAAAAEAAPGDFDACFEHARFLHSLNRHRLAGERYQACLEIARGRADSIQVARALNNLGNLHRDQNRMKAAREAFEEALDIQRKLARANPDTYLPDVAVTLNNLGNLHGTENRMEAARKAYEAALDIRRTLADADPDTYLPYVAVTLNNLGVLHRDQNQIKAAREAFEKALDIQRKLARANPDTYLPDVARTRWNMGRMHAQIGQAMEAQIAFREALKILESFARTNPEGFQPLVEAVQADLAKLER